MEIDNSVKKEISNIKAFNIAIMDVDAFIKANAVMEVTSPFIHESSSNELNAQGIFSEMIFGQVASQERMIRHGFIRLNCHVLHPTIFQNLMALKRFYVEIMSGRSYAIWDPVEKDFVRARDDEKDAHTGYTFFLKHFNQIKFEKNASLKRNNKVEIMNKYKDRLFIDKILVAPAGIRDIREDEGMIEKDSINSLYISLLNLAKAMPEHGDSDDIYDVVHYSIQRKVLEIYEYMLNFVSGKRGFFEAKFGARAVTMGTRNVIASASMEAASPDSPQYHKLDEVKVPLYQAAKGFAHLVFYWIKSTFYGTIVTEGADQIPLINPDKLSLEYVQINDKDRENLLTEEGIMKTIDRFRDPEFRFLPVSASVGTKKYYLYLVYEDGDEITVFRNLEEFKMMYKTRTGKEPDAQKVRPLTYAEMLYVCTYKASLNKSGTVTRYPVTDESSIFVAKTHLVSTVPGRIVKYIIDVESGASIELPEYPILGKGFVDAMQFHPSRRAGLQADFDGNCLTGSTTVQIRYSRIWKDIISSLDYTVSGQDISHVLAALDRDTYIYRRSEDEYDSVVYATIRLDEVPQPGEYTLDRNGAKVYDIPNGCEVLTIKNGIPVWKPFDKMTVEENCEYRTIKVGGRTAEVSTNPSVAIFDTETGELKKVTPVEAEKHLAPYIVKDPSPYGDVGTYMDGWILGALVSDGYIEDKYLGYTKLDDNTRNTVISYFENLFGDNVCYKVYEESPEFGANKLARSMSLHITDPRVRNWAESLEMYNNDSVRNALTKRISMKHLVNGSRQFLVGLFAGLMDGDGSIVIDRNGLVCFRFSTSSLSLVESLKVLAYKLGIRYGVSVTSPRGWSKTSYVVLFNAGDSVGIRDELVCFEPGNVEKIKYWKTINVRTHNDNIPLSKSELKEMKEIVSKYGNKEDLAYFARADIEAGYRRSAFYKFFRFIKNKNVANRVTCWSVHWNRVELIDEPSVATVYDLLVPDTKVFAVNNGLIVYDTVSWIPILGDESNEECLKYYMSPSFYVNPDGSSQIGGDDLCDICLYALTADPPKEEMKK